MCPMFQGAGFPVYSTRPVMNSAVYCPTLWNYLATFQSASPADLEPEYDFVIVGGGTAGCVLANRLSEIPHWKVLLLEAGGEEPEAAKVPAFAKLLWNSSLDWGYTTVPDNRSCGGNGCSWPRGRVLGGSSTINHMIYVRGNPADYDLWQQLGNPGWSYHDVLHYFKKWENNQDSDIDRSLHGSRGPQRVERMRYADTNVWAIVEAFREMGFQVGDVNGVRQDGTVMCVQTYSFNGQRQSANTAFLEPIRDMRHNLYVVTNPFVTRILFGGDKVVKVEFTSNNERTARRVKVRKECILSAGAINSPQILMLSGIGPMEHLDSLGIPIVKNLKVGHNLQDHVSTVGVRFSLCQTSQARLSQRTVDYLEYITSLRGPLSATGVSQVTAFAKCHQVEDEHTCAPEIQYVFGGEVRVSNMLENSIQPSSYYNELVVLAQLMHPESRGYIRLSTRDPQAKPLIFPHYFSVRNDANLLIRAHHYATNLGFTFAFQTSQIKLNTQPLPGCEHFPFNSTSYWECILQKYTQPMDHPVGTCKMGPSSDSEAVVDAKLNVYGIQNLRVIDASIMPTVVTGNTEAAVLMIAEKGADIIKKSWKICK
ncbi:hypothetical protein PR048_028256 [Dryococelus australis]|uniref:Glucose-methanol-choline oxidoreductase N-terminal domain-containing protein n=1 Tax=Dryococelus australis TaxID=614101 RepID=A0ABQ9GIS7_9NEOP|nr:hypothetical protein PR048_028256 [Dryococelus australis]